MDGPEGRQKKIKPSILSLSEVEKSGPRHVCRVCGRPLPSSNGTGICPQCRAEELFKDVKEYVRSNDNVNEYMIADRFDIPVEMVRKWIREGYMSYKTDPGATIAADKTRIHVTLNATKNEDTGWHSGK